MQSVKPCPSPRALAQLLLLGSDYQHLRVSRGTHRLHRQEEADPWHEEQALLSESDISGFKSWRYYLLAV